MSWSEPLAARAREHLPPDIAHRWIAMLRPAFALDADIDGPVVGQLGGLPKLPDDVPWPVWELPTQEHPAPLPYRASIDCGAVPAGQLDIPLPATGTLHFFADEECFEEAPGEHEGSRICYVPAGVDVRERPPPQTPSTSPDDPQLVFEPGQLRARLVASSPSFYSAFLGAAFWQPEPDYDFGHGPHPNWLDRAAPTLFEIFPDDFRNEIVSEGLKHHQLGGYAPFCQWSPENDLWPRPDYPFRDRDDHPDPGSDRPDPDRQPGRHLFNIDGCMMDGGDYRLHWVIRPDDLATLRFDAAAFRVTRCG